MVMPHSSRYHSIILSEARRLLRSGISVIPILPNGSKTPAVAWKPYQTSLPTDTELARWFHEKTRGLAAIGGIISGSLEILDFDAPDLFEPWCNVVEELSPGLIQRLPLSKTPSNGRHIFYRCRHIEANLKLAQRRGLDGKPETLIETRGEGGYAIVPPSPPACHPLQKPYMLSRGDLTAIPTITPDERTILLQAAQSFNEYVDVTRIVSGGISPSPSPAQGTRPGDIFNTHARWPDILEPHGWMRLGQRAEITLWRRPGKRTPGCSATTNYAGSDLLYVFSSNAWPFEPETAYSKIAAYALLEHGGDFHAAARSLAAHRLRTRHGHERCRSVRVYPATLAARRLRTIAAEEVARWHG
jgi:hypothetical protein